MTGLARRPLFHSLSHTLSLSPSTFSPLLLFLLLCFLKSCTQLHSEKCTYVRVVCKILFNSTILICLARQRFLMFQYTSCPSRHAAAGCWLLSIISPARPNRMMMVVTNLIMHAHSLYYQPNAADAVY